MSRKKTKKRSYQRPKQQHNVSFRDDKTLLRARRRNKEIDNDLRRWREESKYEDGRKTRNKYLDETDDVREPVRKNKLSGRVAFFNPKRATVCQRRATRRSVLFALKHTGVGKGVSPKRTFNKYSKIICKFKGRG